jgi:hypothetical protein
MRYLAPKITIAFIRLFNFLFSTYINNISTINNNTFFRFKPCRFKKLFEFPFGEGVMEALEFFPRIIRKGNATVVPIQLTFAFQLVDPIFFDIFEIFLLSKIPGCHNDASPRLKHSIQLSCNISSIIFRRKMMENRDTIDGIEKFRREC